MEELKYVTCENIFAVKKYIVSVGSNMKWNKMNKKLRKFENIKGFEWKI